MLLAVLKEFSMWHKTNTHINSVSIDCLPHGKSIQIPVSSYREQKKWLTVKWQGPRLWKQFAWDPLKSICFLEPNLFFPLYIMDLPVTYEFLLEPPSCQLCLPQKYEFLSNWLERMRQLKPHVKWQRQTCKAASKLCISWNLVFKSLHKVLHLCRQVVPMTLYYSSHIFIILGLLCVSCRMFCFTVRER